MHSGTLRKYSYVSVSFCPFVYKPRSGILYHFNCADIIVEYEASGLSDAEKRVLEVLKSDRVADERASQLFINFQDYREQYSGPVISSDTFKVTNDFVIITTATISPVITASDWYAWKQDLGYNIIMATDGQETITLFESDPTIRLILMDVQMPILDGLEATKKIREIEATDRKKESVATNLLIEC